MSATALRPVPGPRVTPRPRPRPSSATEPTPDFDAVAAQLGGAPDREPYGEQSPYRFVWPS